MKYYVILLLFLISCSDKEENSNANKKKEIPKKFIQPQPYYNLLNELEFNKEVLNGKGVKGYTATYYKTDGPKLPTKVCYVANELTAGKPSFYILQKNTTTLDTVLSEKVQSISTNLHLFNRKVWLPKGTKNNFVITEVYKNDLLQIKERKNMGSGRTDIEIMTYNNNKMIKKDLKGLGTEEYTYDHLGNVSSYLLRQIKKDTLRYYVQTNNIKTTEIKFLKGGSDRFLYEYNADGLLLSIKWMEAKNTLATFQFEYDTEGLLKKRVIQSNIKAFPSSTTEYMFQF